MALFATWTTPTERTNGELITPTIWNTDVGNNLLFLYNGVIARYTTAAGQSIANNTETIVNFDTQNVDNKSAVTTGASWKFTAPVAGAYLVSAAVLFESSTGWGDTEFGRLTVYRSNVLYEHIARQDSYGSASPVLMHLAGATIVNMSQGDYLDVRVTQISGASLALLNNAAYNHVTIARL